MSLITSESNYPRKSHRVEFPLRVALGDKVYPATDWSLTGIALSGLTETFARDQQIEARIILPMVESAITFTVTLAYRARRKEITGFKFVNLSPRNKRLLRHYIELAVEGRIDNVEDLVAIATTPGIRSPLEDALNLTELESEGLLKHFKHRTSLALVVGLAFVVTVIGVLFYNTSYRLQAIGFAAGNLERVTANHDGILRAVHVVEGDFADADTPLFVIDDAEAQTAAGDPAPPAGGALLDSLRQEFDERGREFDNAQALYAKRLITNKDLAIVRNHFQQARTNMLREEGLQSGRRTHRASGSQEVRAPARGKIFRIAKAKGEFVRANEPVLLIERDVKPFVLIRLMTEDALKLRIGMPAKIYVPFEDRDLDAEVTAIGHAAVNAEMTESLEGSLNETLVKLEFAEPDVRLPANARVKVWIRTWNDIPFL